MLNPDCSTKTDGTPIFAYFPIISVCPFQMVFQSFSRKAYLNKVGTRFTYNVELNSHIFVVFALMMCDRSRWLVAPVVDAILMVTAVLLLRHWSEAQHVHSCELGCWFKFSVHKEWEGGRVPPAIPCCPLTPQNPNRTFLLSIYGTDHPASQLSGLS